MTLLRDHLKLVLPSADELTARAKARHEQALAEMAADNKSFLATSLERWMAEVQAAGVSAVPATVLCRLPRKTFLGFEQPSADDLAHWRQFRTALDSLPADHMVRWDCCASLDVKSVMGHPDGDIEETFRDLSPDDPRAFDIVYDQPVDELPVLARPWVRALRVEGFPVEFRVFVRDSEVLGVASYYPQRPLPETVDILRYAQEVREAAERVVASLKQAQRYPWMPAYKGRFSRGLVHCTLDFLVTPDGHVLFLEAGPAFGAGAHPCAFLGQADTVGLALSLAPGVPLR